MSTPAKDVIRARKWTGLLPKAEAIPAESLLVDTFCSSASQQGAPMTFVQGLSEHAEIASGLTLSAASALVWSETWWVFGPKVFYVSAEQVTGCSLNVLIHISENDLSFLSACMLLLSLTQRSQSCQRL